MKYDRIYNFSAGPSMLPLPVLEEVHEELFNYRGSGQSVMEMSHRSKVFQGIHDEAKADLRALMGIPENYKILFIQGGATLQFSMIPMNLKKNGVFDYVVSGSWSNGAAKEAARFGKVNVVANSKDRNYAYVPDVSDLPISEDADYLYICENETIYGTTYQELPNTKGKILISDQSSMFLSKPVNVSDYGIIYGGVQKNVGPAGMAIVIIREDLIREDIDESVPVYLRYHVQDKGDSMYNTPNCWAIYFCGKVFKYLQSIGGLEAVHKNNVEKAKPLYDFLDQSKMFKGTVDKKDRSLMNVPFVTGDEELDAKVVAATKAAGFENLKGHRTVGGLRASIYNAMPKEGVVALVEFLKDFEAKHG
ncbi:MAG TPA: 3-phosphoserine/phosphohydroxythreonine transaminase [Anaerolineaceae bacterium]|nr:3-phosphoserine/phosphohydroxythreonine transaminase [Anaerolineaceae bacterium]